MTAPTILVSTWDQGLFSVCGAAVRQERAGESLRGLADDGRGGVLAVVGGHALCRRSADGQWSTLAQSEAALSCCVAAGGAIFASTDDAQVLRLDAAGVLQALPGFDTVEGRERWYAGTALVDGKVLGPPLGVRSMAASCDGAVLLANVHVGGIPRSADGGKSWRPSIDIDSDVHQVCTHPLRPELAVAAAAVGLCISRDAGTSWTVEQRGLHAPYCSAVAFGRDQVFVSASIDPFDLQGAVYRRPIDGDGPLQRLGAGLPEWLSGRVDTGCIAARDAAVALIDGSGSLYVSHDDGESWRCMASGLPFPSGLHIC